MKYDIELRGTLCGPIWQGPRCSMDISADLTREAARIVGGKVTLRDVIQLVMCERAGDFQNAQLTADSEIMVRSGHGRTARHRWWPVTAFPSIADYVDAEALSCDFGGNDDA